MIPFATWVYLYPTQTTPAYYWNVKSAEERIRNIYFSIEDITNYLEYIKENYDEMEIDIETIKNDIETLFEISGAEGIKDIALNPTQPKFNVTYHNNTSKTIDFVGDGVEITSDGNSLTFKVEKQAGGVTPEQLEAVKKALQGEITKESTRAIAAEKELSSNITNETNRAISAEGELDNKITAASEELKLDVLGVAKDLSDEVKRATETEEMKLSKTNEIKALAYFITEEEAKTAPEGTLAFYPEVE